MGPPDTDFQDRPADSDELTLARVARGRRRIVDFSPKELTTEPAPSRIRELLDPLPDLLSEHFADEESAACRARPRSATPDFS